MLAFEKEQAQQQPSKPLVAQTMIWKWDCVSCFACSGANENPPSRLRALNSGTFEPFEDAPPPCYPRNHSCASPKLQAICQTLDQALSECHLNCSELLLPYLVPELGPWSLADQLGKMKLLTPLPAASWCLTARLDRWHPPLLRPLSNLRQAMKLNVHKITSLCTMSTIWSLRTFWVLKLILYSRLQHDSSIFQQHQSCILPAALSKPSAGWGLPESSRKQALAVFSLSL